MPCSQPIPIFLRSAGHAYLMPCNKCADCLNRKKQSWILRMQAEKLYGSFSRCYFISLSYCDTFLPYESYSRVDHGQKIDCISTGESLLNPYDLRKFFERYRITFKKKFAYFAAGEYGDPANTHRPHFHIVFFTNDDWQTVVREVNIAWSRLRAETSHERYMRYKRARRLGMSCKRDSKSMLNRDSFGRVNVLSVTNRRICYVAKYVNKILWSNEVVPPFIRCSNGLGKGWLGSPMAKACKENNQHYSYLDSGLPCALPRYYSQRLFTVEQMEQFKLQMSNITSLPDGIEPGSERARQFYECCFTKEKLSRRNRLLRFHGVPYYC